MTVRNYLSLFKLQTGALITFSSIVAFAVVSKGGISLDRLILLVVVMMMATASSAALNHYFDMDIDRVMERTRNRPLSSGKIKSPGKAFFVAISLFLASLLISIVTLNYLVALHIFLGAFVYVVVYTVWLKRRSSINIVIGGLAGSLAVLAGSASARPEFCLPPILIAIIVFLWTPSHFWSYAIVHREEYGKAGIPMLPVIIGEKRTALYIFLNTSILFLASLLPFFLGYMGRIYFISALAIGTFFIIRNVQLLLRPSKEMAWKNFKASMVYLSVLFFAILLDIGIKVL